MRNFGRKLCAAFVSIAMLLAGTVLPVNAEGSENVLDDYFHQVEQQRIEEISGSNDPSAYLGLIEENVPLNNDIATYPNCTDCNWFTVSVCAAEGTLHGVSYHNYGFLLQDRCQTYYFTSRGGEMCPSCHKVLWQYGSHYCIENHMQCSKGYFDVCPMDVS